MAKKMLIDATHTEETRVVVVDGTKVEEFDFESESKRQLAGNIYLAKVTRVEPSLQAAFIDYGGNRHGFLAFSEIHPDYYQIPVADRKVLMDEERADADAVMAREEREDKSKARPRIKAADATSDDAVETAEVAPSQISGMETIDLDADDNVADVFLRGDESGLHLMGPEAPRGSTEASSEAVIATASDAEPVNSDEKSEPSDAEIETNFQADVDTVDVKDQDDAVEHDDDHKPRDLDGDQPSAFDASLKDESIESIADEDDEEDIRPARKPRPRRYKIQEVVKVRQILLVQVVKEERGNKGAALTSYLSLAGRYCVLMPNTARGGGISRKITNAVDRKKLKEIAGEIEVPQGAGLIVRTAGAKRTKTEIKRDYEYLQRLWEQIRELTLKSIAPSKIYEEGDLIKRSIRDLYNRDIDEVQVEGERGYRIAKDFMKMIMPSHAKNVRHYQDSLPLFARFQVESYLNSMFNPVVQLKSGGYIVIDVTEALVAVDVNSGRATKEGSIEDTALKTNLEAAEEVARQLRLRDLAGLIVIDFIDMDERKNNLSVEKRIKDKLKTDRARIQIGRISGFGLMEMSRQRLRPGMIEATTQACPHCHGTGLIRSDDNLALSILRQIEEEGVRRRSREVVVTCPVGIANFLMNKKRENIAQIEARYGMSVRIEGDPSLVSPDFNIEKLKTATRVIPEPDQNVVSVDSNILDQIDAEAEAEAEAQSPDEDEADVAATEAGSDEEQKPKKRRRRRRRRKSGGPEGEDAGISVEADANAATDENAAEQPAGDPSQTDTAPQDAGSVTALTQTEDPLAGSSDAVPVEVNAGSTDSAEAVDTGEAATEEAPKKPARKRSTTQRKRATKPVVDKVTAADVAPGPATEPAVEGVAETAAEDEPVKKPRRRRIKVDPVKDAAENTAQPETEQAAPVVESVPVPEVAVVPAVETVAEPYDVVPTSAAAPVLEVVKEVQTLEPVIEQVPTELEAPAKPKRHGWWSLGK